MQQAITINPSIATIAHVKVVSKEESRPVVYENKTVDWPGTYTVRIWNSPEKITEYEVAPETLTVDGKLITLTVDPEALSLPVGNLYYEIFNVEMKSIFFKGDLQIIK